MQRSLRGRPPAPRSAAGRSRVYPLQSPWASERVEEANKLVALVGSQLPKCPAAGSALSAVEFDRRLERACPPVVEQKHLPALGALGEPQAPKRRRPPFRGACNSLGVPVVQ